MRSPSVSPRAVALVLGATLCFVTVDAMMKHLSERYNVPFLVWARYSVQVLLMAAWLVPGKGWGVVRTRHLWLQLLRGVLVTASSLSFFTALTLLPLAEVVALNYLAPVLLVPLAALFLEERMTGMRWSMLALCLVGMVCIVRPGSQVVGAGAVFGIMAAVFYAGFMVLTRRLAGEDPLVTLLYPALSGAALLTLALPLIWTDAPVPLTSLALIVVCGALGAFAHYLFILAFQRAPASGLAPFTYMQLVWATGVGWLVFGTFPDAPSLAGMGIIAASGMGLALNERWRTRQALDAAAVSAVVPDAQVAPAGLAAVTSRPAALTRIRTAARGRTAAPADGPAAGPYAASAPRWWRPSRWRGGAFQGVRRHRAPADNTGGCR